MPKTFPTPEVRFIYPMPYEPALEVAVLLMLMDEGKAPLDAA